MGTEDDLWLDHVGVIGVLAMNGFSEVGRVRDSSMLIYQHAMNQ